MCNAPDCRHDLDDDFSDLFGDAPDAGFSRAVLNTSNTTSARTFEETCHKCKGTGQFRSYSGSVVGNCFTCKGKGVLRFKTSPAQREKSRNAAADRRAKQDAEARAACEAWLEANPAEAEWLRDAAGRGFEFAASLWESLRKYGSFTEKQEAAVRNATAKSQARKAEWAAAKAARDADKTDVDVSRIAVGFATAKANGLRFPKLRLESFTFSLAPASGRNAGAIYVKADETYLGKIADGKFTRSRDCDDDLEARIVAACANPAAAAEAYGKQTGRCSCCGRELTNEESIARSIGPICASKWGW